MNSSFREPTTLGRTGLRVSRLGIGAGYGVPARSVERAFREYGVNYLYWSLPRRGPMGEAIRNLAKTDRDNLVIVLQSYDHFGFALKRFAERQLRALGLDYADVFILGWFNRVPPKRVLDAVARLKHEGKVRHIAMSGHHRPTFAQMAQRDDLPIDIYMIRYNAVHRGAEQDIFPRLPTNDRPGITTYTTTCWGALLNPRKMPPGERPMTSTECYRFALSNPHVDLCLCGPKNDDEMSAALKTLDHGPLRDDELARARRIGDFIHG